jgi:hypothetical protein
MSDLDRDQQVIADIESRQGRVLRESEGICVDLRGVEEFGGLVEMLTLVTSRLPDVTSLDLSGTKIDDKLLPRLKGLTRLENLKLRDTRITDNGLVHLADFRDLKQLDLGRTRITDAGLPKLKTLTTLITLTLPRRISMAALLDLKESLGIRWIGQV